MKSYADKSSFLFLMVLLSSRLETLELSLSTSWGSAGARGSLGIGGASDILQDRVWQTEPVPPHGQEQGSWGTPETAPAQVSDTFKGVGTG